MAVSGPVVAAILIGALLAQAGTLVTAQRNADNVALLAHLAWERRHAAMREQQVRFDNASWDNVSSELTLRLTNTGTVTLDAGRADVLLDGAYGTTAVTSRRVAGASTAVWAQGQQLVLVLDAPTPPTDVAVLTEYGLLTAWRGV